MSEFGRGSAGSSPAVGLVGLGRMGQAIGHRLMARGHRLVVHNRTEAKADDLLVAGAEWAPSPAEVALRADVVLTVLFDEAAVREVYLGPDGLLEARGGEASGGSPLLVEMSTIRAETTLEIHDAAAERGSRLVDAALVGPPPAALAGQLLVLAGGDAAAVADARRALDSFARRVAHLGPSGTGVIMKLVLMHSMGVYFSGLAESLAVGSQLGLAPAQMLGVILDSHGAPPALRDRAEALLAELDQRPVPVGFPVAGVRKDLESVLATAADAGVESTMAAAAHRHFSGASEAGFGDHDLISIVAYRVEQSRSQHPNPDLANRLARTAVEG